VKIERRKVVIVGAGNVGSAVLFTLLSSTSIAEIVIIDKNEKKAYGEGLDGSHATAFAYSPNIQVRHGDYSDCSDAGIVVMTAGPSADPSKPVDRNELLKVNMSVMKEVMENVCRYTKEAVIIIVSNPVDALTYYAMTHFDYPQNKIFGTGTLLDTARFRRILSYRYMVDTKNVHGYILGEHGTTAFATWSTVNIAGIPIDLCEKTFKTNTPLDKDAILEEVKKVGYEVLMAKGHTNFGIAKSVERIIQTILINELSILPVTTRLTGQYSIHDVAISLPCVMTKDGIGSILEIPLSGTEVLNLQKSAAFVKAIYDKAIDDVDKKS